MCRIGFNNSSQSFTNLVQTARTLTNDQNLSTDDKARLLELARSDGDLNQEETTFIDLLENPENIALLSDDSFNASSFSFNMSELPQSPATESPITKPPLQSSSSADTSKPPSTGESQNSGSVQETTRPGMTATSGDRSLGEYPFDPSAVRIHDQGLDSHSLYNSPTTTTYMAENIRQNPVVTSNPAVAVSVNNFLRSVENNGTPDRECCIYLQELLNRQPQLSPTDLTNVLDRLSTMTTTQYIDHSNPRQGQESLNSLELVRSGLHDIAMPSDIDQRETNSCSGASVQMSLALTNPVEYITMLDNLAQNRPHVTLGINGAEGGRDGVSIAPNWRFNQGGNSETRTISSRIMQNAIMDYTNGSLPHDTTGDPSRPGFGNLGTIAGRDGGRLLSQKVELMENLFSRDLESGNPLTAGLDALGAVTFRGQPIGGTYARLEASQPSITNPITIAMKYGGGPESLHVVDVIGINNDNHTVTIMNPHGMQQTFPQELFRTLLVDAITPER